MKKLTSTSLIVAALALVGASPAMAISNITIADKAPDFNGFNGNGSTTSAGSTTLSGLGAGLEDNETERVGSLASIAGQTWDMEAFMRDGKKLFIVSGYDLLNGLAGGRPGDLFINVGSPTSPTRDPLTNPPGGNVPNSQYPYTWAVDLSLAHSYVSGGSYSNVAAFGPKTHAYKLNANSVLNTAVNDGFRSNPWRFQNGSSFDSVNLIDIKYHQNQTNAQTTSLIGTTFAGTWHNVLEIDLSFLGSIPDNTNVWFSYTMECGNDSLKGFDNDGFRIVPEGGMTVILISLGLVALSFAARRRRA